MKKLFLLFALAALSAGAQSISGPDLNAAAKDRASLAVSVVSGAIKAPVAVARLRNSAKEAAFVGDRDEDFAFSAIDVGNRLIAAGKSSEAEQFFRAAETALTSSLAARSGKEKARPLATRAMLRARFLGDQDGAEKDAAEALVLVPDDQGIKALARNVSRGKGKKEPAPSAQFVGKPWERGN